MTRFAMHIPSSPHTHCDTMLADSANTGHTLPIFDYFSLSESSATVLGSSRAAATTDRSTADQLPRDQRHTELFRPYDTCTQLPKNNWPVRCPAAPKRQLPMQAYSSRKSAEGNICAMQSAAFRQKSCVTQAAAQSHSMSKLIRNASPITSAQALLARVLADAATAINPHTPVTAKAGAFSAQNLDCHQNNQSLKEMIGRSFAQAATTLPAADVGLCQGSSMAGRAIAGSSPEVQPQLKQVKRNEPLQADRAEVINKFLPALIQRLDTESALWRSQQDQSLIRIDDPVDFALEGPFVTHMASSPLPLTGPTLANMREYGQADSKRHAPSVTPFAAPTGAPHGGIAKSSTLKRSFASLQRHPELPSSFRKSLLGSNGSGASVESAAKRCARPFFRGSTHRPLFINTFELPLAAPPPALLRPFYLPKP